MLLAQKNGHFANFSRRREAKLLAAVPLQNNPAGRIECLKFTPAEIIELSSLYAQAYQVSKELQKTVASLKKSGYYAQYENLPDTMFLRQACASALNGLNHIFDIYYSGIRPQYPKIDAKDLVVNPQSFEIKIDSAIDALTRRDFSIPYQASLQIAFLVLKLNGRNEAFRYETLLNKLSRKVRSSVGKTKWKSYSYSVILVPGKGPEQPGLLLDTLGMWRCKQAAERFKNHLAPYIIVSGGHVHPAKTPFNEALEMKAYLIHQFHLPADKIIVEPYARHTTTNLRNCTRLIYKYSFPIDHPILIVTDEDQTRFIRKDMGKTAIRDLGYLPYKNMVSITVYETSFYPERLCLQVDSLDPLDP